MRLITIAKWVMLSSLMLGAFTFLYYYGEESLAKQGWYELSEAIFYLGLGLYFVPLLRLYQHAVKRMEDEKKNIDND